MSHSWRKSSLRPPNVVVSSSIYRFIEIDRMSDESFFLINRVMEICLPPSLSSAELVSNDDLLQTCCAIIIFNLAIAHHRFGLVRRKLDLLGKSKMLYLLVLKMASQVPCHASSAFGLVIFLLGVACRNNLAHIFQTSSEGADNLFHAGQMMDSLSALMDSCPDALRAIFVALHPRIARGIDLNLHFHHAKDTAAAPAA
jgi:hypothetical protein